MSLRIPGDLSEQEIERRFHVARWDIRRGGTGELARPTIQPHRAPTALRTADVLRAMADGDTTIGALAKRLGRQIYQVWGHVCFLRKCQKVEVKRYITSERGRKLSVYGVKA